MSNPSSVVILSGGLDSSTLLHYVAKTLESDIVALTVNYGQTHSKEIESACLQVEDVQASTGRIAQHLLLDLSEISSKAFVSSLTGASEIPDLEEVVGHPQPPTYVPYRNLILLSLGAAVAESQGSETIYYGAQSADLYGYWDTTGEFVAKVNDVLLLNRENDIKIAAPFLMLKKWDIVRLGLKLGVDYSKTWSCYRGLDHPCGTCATCRERLRAFEELEIKDPLEALKELVVA